MKAMQRRHWLMTALFVVGSVSLASAAWYGSLAAVALLAIFNVMLAFLLEFSDAVRSEGSRISEEAIKAWRYETAFSQRVTGDYMGMLGRLYELDPTAAEVYQDRLSQALAERHPAITAYIEERAEQAEMN